jgi:hypothetical protein
MIEMPPTQQRVPLQSPPTANEEIRTLMRARVIELAGKLEAIELRLAEIEQEWDVDRTFQANAAAVSLAGLLLSAFSRKWALLPLIASGFLLQHAMTGWCPPVEFFRRMGVRTAREIEQERFALKALRGDFEGVRAEGVDPYDAAHAALHAVGLDG